VNCSQTRNLLHAYVDGELDLVRHLELEHHLQDCPACAEAHESRQALRKALRADGLYQRAPAGLRERLAAAAGEEKPSVPYRSSRRQLIAGAAAACVLLAAGAASFVLFWRPWLPPADEALVRELVGDHVRSLQVAHLTDVPSSDKHTVKPFFKDKLNFSPPVEDLSPAFTLVGGRLDYLDGRPVAALVYRVRAHDINLFIWPAARDAWRGTRTLERQGFHIVCWVQGDMNCWAISDLNPAELSDFARLLQERGR
jgi:anti-sigma factor RsiW